MTKSIKFGFWEMKWLSRRHKRIIWMWKCIVEMKIDMEMYCGERLYVWVTCKISGQKYNTKYLNSGEDIDFQRSTIISKLQNTTN